MIWECSISFFSGIIISTIGLLFSNQRSRQKKDMQQELKIRNLEAEKWRKELTGHFSQSAEFLEKMAKDYRNLCRSVAHSSNNVQNDHNLHTSLSNGPGFSESEANNDQMPVKIMQECAKKD